jgi:MFS family permease
MNIPKYILPVIVLSQFCCASLWFAGNGVMADLILRFNLEPTALGHLTSAVQFGFISGTLIFALFTVSDRYSPSVVFFASAMAGALCNLGILLESNTLLSLMAFRYFTGLFLAGIYPVGMKIAADYFEMGLGKSLGFLVGALVLGTAFPHLLKGYTAEFSWEWVIWITSILAITGGALLLVLVPNGPYRKRSAGLNFSAFFKVFHISGFRAAALGYFGHMWELYAFWAFIPFMIESFQQHHVTFQSPVGVLSFLIIGVGGPACVAAGYLSQKWGAKPVATAALASSCCCCLLSPLFFVFATPIVFQSFLIFWGIVVIADSPLFSTLVAHNSVREYKGTALTIVNCIGFAITIFSIQLLNYLREFMNPNYIYIFLAFGPVLGLMALWRNKKHPN